MPFFKNVFRSKDKADKHAHNTAAAPAAPPKPRWEDAWSRKDVAPEEMQELIHVCSQEMKSRALDLPFLLLPFRPALIKWCWSRLPGGVVTWDAYELFRTGESDSNFARHAFDTFIPLSVETEARKSIIFDFFDLLAAVAARGKTNGMGGRKLSRMAGWWAFEHTDDGKGFDGGYRSWERGADASSHLFFAYLRHLSPDANAISGISALPRSLQSLLAQTEYPPQTPALMQTTTTKVVMIVDSVSPTPYSLLRRAKHFEYRDDDEALQQFSSYEDPVKVLTDECRRVLHAISTANQSAVSPDGSTRDASWSRFEDMGFSGLLESSNMGNGGPSQNSPREFSSMRSGPRSRNNDFGRPTTPSWADFLSSGFADENGQAAPAPLLLPPDKVLPPIGETARVHSSQSHMRNHLQVEDDLEPGELASITRFDLDDTFWWVWQTSLASEEPTERKAAFGRCTLLETRIPGAKWLVMEEQVKGASPGPEEGAYIAEKKGRFSFTRRGRLGRRKSTGKKPPPPSKEPYNRTTSNTPMSKTSILPDQHARIQAAAARLAQNERDQTNTEQVAQRRARKDDAVSTKTNSVLTLQPNLMNDAAAAMKWDKKFGEGAKDKDALRAQYLGDVHAGRGSTSNLMATANGARSPSPALHRDLSNRDLPSLPKSEVTSPKLEAPPSPAPWPVTPSADAAESSKAEASSTAQIPLPALPLDEKPTTQSDYLDQHPALRKAVPERKPAAPATHEARESVEQSATTDGAPGKKPSPKKLKKNAGGGGFRKLFGKKKAESQTTTAEPVQHLEVEEARGGRTTPQPEPEHYSAPVRESSPTYSAGKSEPVTARSHSASPSPAVDAVEPQAYREIFPRSADATYEEPRETPAQAFSRFDQGPMDDMPAFVPEDDVDSDDMVSPIVPTASHHAEENQATPTRAAYAAAGDDASEHSADEGQFPQPQDRWALIRKNAADRAARLSEEQSRRSQSQSARTDEGETSGEETIESRVARIKARVAELTGNMEGGSPAR
ncbi:DUF1708-domain-containing protein [Amniculicola lignicola CBS 123094]|uniref:DUF1708-domain-containing protein n=1 Tax=Amniculicola lignicola CBS 123094 TaxID=1392246 RepID=A0A6A5WCM7_9PLEO|nr:DUF1708-domain-containing protein [Amniculicola lignicola CBS 123094]